jgi:hypothetical protein
MLALALPPGAPDELQARLYERQQVEVVVQEWEGRLLLRVSVAPYTTSGTSTAS